MTPSIWLALTGDVMLGRVAGEVLHDRGPRYPWGNLLPLLRAADLTLVNLECVIARTGRPWSRWIKTFHFRAGPWAIPALRMAGIDAVVLANNHVLDFEEPALIEMLAHLERAGIAYAGAGRDLDEARRPAWLEAGGLRIGVIAFTDNEPSWAATATRPGVNWLEVSLGEGSFSVVRESILQARGNGADLVVFSNHWGPNMVERPPPLFREFAHAVIDAGADVYYGHSAHLFQGVEVYQGRPIIYDAGDLVDDYAVDPWLRNDRGLLFRLQVEPVGVRRIELAPTIITDCQVNLAVGHERNAIVERIGALSAELGTDIQRDGDRLWVACRPCDVASGEITAQRE